MHVEGEGLGLDSEVRYRQIKRERIIVIGLHSN
jgi:hypothetical protein